MPARSSTWKRRAIGTSVLLCAMIEKAMHTAMSVYASSPCGIPACSTSSPYTTDAKPFGPNQAATSFSRRSNRVPSSDSSSEAGRISTMARTTATYPPKDRSPNSCGVSSAPNTSSAANLASSASASPSGSNDSFASGETRGEHRARGERGEVGVGVREVAEPRRG